MKRWNVNAMPNGLVCEIELWLPIVLFNYSCNTVCMLNYRLLHLVLFRLGLMTAHLLH